MNTTTERRPNRTWRCRLCGETWTVEDRVGRVSGMASTLHYHRTDRHPETVGVEGPALFDELVVGRTYRVESSFVAGDGFTATLRSTRPTYSGVELGFEDGDLAQPGRVNPFGLLARRIESIEEVV